MSPVPMMLLGGPGDGTVVMADPASQPGIFVPKPGSTYTTSRDCEMYTIEKIGTAEDRWIQFVLVHSSLYLDGELMPQPESELIRAIMTAWRYRP